MTDTNFAGMSKSDCPDACNAIACVIGGKPYCFHPCKGGIPSSFRQDPAMLPVQEIFADACKTLGVKNPHTMPNRLTP
jgi:hypothetical protein